MKVAYFISFASPEVYKTLESLAAPAAQNIVI